MLPGRWRRTVESGYAQLSWWSLGKFLSPVESHLFRESSAGDRRDNCPNFINSDGTRNLSCPCVCPQIILQSVLWIRKVTNKTLSSHFQVLPPDYVIPCRRCYISYKIYGSKAFSVHYADSRLQFWLLIIFNWRCGSNTVNAIKSVVSIQSLPQRRRLLSI